MNDHETITTKWMEITTIGAGWPIDTRDKNAKYSV